MRITSEWNKFAVRTYKANFVCNEKYHTFNRDIRDATLSADESVSDEEAYEHIDKVIPDHDVLLAGFPLPAVFNCRRIKEELAWRKAWL